MTAYVLHGNSLDVLRCMPDACVDAVVTDPPYFLSDGGSTCSSGERVAVDKGAWDRPTTPLEMHAWNVAWLIEARRVLREDGTIWISGTHHNIHSIGFALQCLEFRILNSITWEKPNPPPNLGCRCFTHSTETLLWAARSVRSKHHFDYDRMREENAGKQMKDVWRYTAPGADEKEHGKHPTQKPVELLRRVLRASVQPGGIVLDPFFGSGTTGVAAVQEGVHVVGIDLSADYCAIARARIEAAIHAL